MVSLWVGMMRLVRTTALVFGVVAALSIGTARAGVVISTGLVGGSGDVENVLFNDPGLTLTGFTIEGITNQTATIIEFSGAESLSGLSGGGQSRIEDTAGNGFNFLFYEVQSGQGIDGFVKTQFNIDAASDGEVIITANIFGGGSVQQIFNLSGNGQNFFTLLANSGDLISRVTIDTNDVQITSILMNDVQQVRVGGFGGPDAPPPPNGLPEPATLGLLGLGLVGLGLTRFRRSRAS